MELKLEIIKSTDPTLRVGTVRILEASGDLVLRFGRAFGNFVRMAQDSKSISRHHAHIYFDGAGFCLVDTSMNGTLLNESVLRGQHKELRTGDRIAIGGYEFHVLLGELRKEAGETFLREPWPVG